MNILMSVAFNAVSVTTGAGIAFLGYIHGAFRTPFSASPLDPFCLCLAEVPALHQAHAALIVSLGVTILFGVRTRVVAAFAAVLLLAHAGGCISSLGHHTHGARQFLTALMVPLIFLVSFGGGTGALYRRGWDRLPF